VSRLSDVYQANRALVWLCVVIFVNQLGFGAVIPVVPLYAASFGVPVSAIGLAVAVYGFARFVGNVPTAQIADRMGRRWALVIGEILTAAGNLGCGLSVTFEQFLLFRFVAGLGAVMVVTTGQVILADVTTLANRGRLMGIYQGVFLVGVGAGPLPGGLLAVGLGLSAPFFVFAALGVVAGVVAFDKVPETRGTRERDLPASKSDPAVAPGYLEQVGVLLRRPGFSLVSLVSFVQFFARTGVVFAIVPVRASVDLALTADQIGVAMTVVTLTNAGMVYFSGVMVDRLGRKPVIVPSTLLSGVAITGFALAPDYGWFLVSALLWGVASGVSGPSPGAYAADMAPPGMNAVTMGTYRMISDFGYVVGPMALGAIADLWGNEPAIIGTGLAFVVSGSLYGLLAPETAEKRR
jgi:MFS family permease